MKKYLLEGIFTDNHPKGDELKEIISEHALYLTNIVNKDNVLLAGPKADKSGGIIIVQSDNIEDFCNNDPLVQKKVQTYRVIEFSVNEYEESIERWLK